MLCVSLVCGVCFCCVVVLCEGDCLGHGSCVGCDCWCGSVFEHGVDCVLFCGVLYEETGDEFVVCFVCFLLGVFCVCGDNCSVDDWLGACW